jgi:hypothetical protein
VIGALALRTVPLGQMFGDGRMARLEAAYDLTRGRRSLREHVDDLSASWIGDGAKGVGGSRLVGPFR